jgi:transposase
MSLSAKTLSQCWLSIQGRLFSFLEEELGELSKKQRQLVSILELIRIERFITAIRGWPGRPEKDRRAIARAFVAKVVYNMGTTRQLLERLESDANLRRLCGWERKNDVPSEATFSRAFAEFSESKLLEEVHRALIEKYETPRLVGHISRDSTEIEARERIGKKVKKEKLPKKKRGRPKKGEVRIKPVTRLERQQKMTLEEMIKDLPTLCDSGTKVNSKGYPEYWAGYKLHLDVADGQIPISCILTSASVHDSQVALPLATMTAQRVTNLYDLMDAAYDTPIIREHSQSLGHQPIIDYNNRRGSEKREFAPHEAQRFKERTTVERVYARLKDEFGARTIRVRGAPKVMASLMFGILALTADEILRLVS